MSNHSFARALFLISTSWRHEWIVRRKGTPEWVMATQRGRSSADRLRSATTEHGPPKLLLNMGLRSPGKGSPPFLTWSQSWLNLRVRKPSSRSVSRSVVSKRWFFTWEHPHCWLMIKFILRIEAAKTLVLVRQANRFAQIFGRASRGPKWLPSIARIQWFFSSRSTFHGYL